MYIYLIYIYIHTRRKRRATAPPLHPTPSASNGWVQEFKVSWIQGFKVPNDISLSLLTHTIHAHSLSHHTLLAAPPLPPPAALLSRWVSVSGSDQRVQALIEGFRVYRGFSLIRKRTPLGPYRGPIPRVLGVS